jgi:hypothetical protein
MALIACPECAQQVSSLAAACPKCAAPIAQRDSARAVGQPVTTTEATSKQIKLHQAAGALLSIVGVVVAIADGPDNPGHGIGVAVVGLVWFVGARIRGWWHHG